jgi:uncharacterized protein (TIGR02266 family)
MTDSRRQDPRIEANVLVDFMGQDVLLFHHVENISLGGICIHGTTAESVGSEVSLAITFPQLEESLEVLGEVAWVNTEAPLDMGIRFTALSAKDKDVIRRYIATQGGDTP